MHPCKVEEIMNKPLLTIIIPVYNVENYLSRCLDSLVMQIKNKVEVILIDDSSSDKSFYICKQYAKKYQYISVIRQRHAGLSSARNLGIKLAKGKYISFIDSDDFVAKNYIKEIVTTIKSEKFDIVIFNFAFKYSNNIQNSTTYDGWDNGLVSKEKVFRSLPESSYAWNKAYRRTLFNNILYPVGQYYEDVNTTFKLINNSKNIFYIDKVMYFYVQRNSSIMHQSSPKKARDNFWANLCLYNFLKNNSYYAETANYQSKRLTLFAFYYCLMCKGNEKDIFNKAKKILIEGKVPGDIPITLKFSIIICKKFPKALYILKLIRKIRT